jgi:hypothetical protein
MSKIIAIDEKLQTQKRYEMYHGLFASVDNDAELTPEFGMLVKELQSPASKT